MPAQRSGQHLIGNQVAYLIFEQVLGAGGMGEVYVAFDERLERRVAVKAIRSNFRLDAEIRGRFAREAKILSQLEHPNICRVYDYFSADDADFLVLEWIHGSTLNDALDKGLSYPRKLEIACLIAAGLQAAHAKQIVHRDLKPGNVMITDRDELKILDFGLARPVGDPADMKSLPPADHGSDAFVTTVGQIMGTPMFMSPEQAHGKNITTASDMYSFGLLLQWLFTESLPYEPGISSFELIVRAGKANTVPVEGLDSDLTRLINRLKSADPGVRPTASEARRDLLDVIEAPRRRKRRFVAIAFVALLVMGLLGTSVGLIQARRAQAETFAALSIAETEAAKSKEIISVFQEFLTSPDPANRGIDLKVTELIEAFQPTMNGLSEHPEVKATILHTFGKTLDALGDNEEAMNMLEEAVELRMAVFGPKHPETLDSQHLLGVALFHVGFMADAELLFREVLSLRRDLLGEDHPDTLHSQFYLAATLDFLGRSEEAEPIFQETLERRIQVLGQSNPDKLTAMSRLSACIRHLGRLEEAEDMERNCLVKRREVLGPDHPDTLMSMSNLSKVLWDLKQDQEAETLSWDVIEGRRRVLGPLHPYTRYALYDLRRALRSRNRVDEAAEITRQIDVILRESGADIELGQALDAGGETALFLVETRLREGNQQLMTPNDVARVAYKFNHEGLQDRAIATLELAIEYFPQSYGAYSNLADFYDEQGELKLAETYYRKALALAPRNRYLKRRLADVVSKFEAPATH